MLHTSRSVLEPASLERTFVQLNCSGPSRAGGAGHQLPSQPAGHIRISRPDMFRATMISIRVYEN